jgi:chemotaxis protein methyltransferase CheR
MNQDVADIASQINQSTGRDIAVFDQSFLLKTIEKRLTVTALKNLREYRQFLYETEAEAATLLHALTISYSEFFRNPMAFAMLEALVIPRLIEEGKNTGRLEIRVWSAGCSAGQEPYSIAMLLAEAGAAYRIFATDISTTELADARLGMYEAEALKNVRLKQLGEHFTRQGDTYIINPELVRHIDFAFYDLLDEHSASPPASIYGDFDVVLCSNLLFYYRQDIRQAILTKVYHSLSPGGYLVSGETERGMIEKTDGFRSVSPPAAVFQKVQR